jgi:hypothetical protein
LFVSALGSSLIVPPLVYLDPYEKKIECENGVKISSDQLSSQIIDTNSYDQDTKRDNDIKIKRMCAPDTMYLSKLKMQKILDERPKGLLIDDALNEFIKNGWIVEGVNSDPNKVYKEYTSDDFKKITYEIKKEIKWVEMINILLASFFGTLIFFEFTRRVFYYVVLGAIKPKK